MRTAGTSKEKKKTEFKLKKKEIDFALLHPNEEKRTRIVFALSECPKI